MRALAASLLVAWLRAASSNPKHPGDTKTDYYKLLKLKKGFSEKELKTAYRNAAKKYHPDKNPGAISASRCVEAPSRHRRDSCPSHHEVGGFFSDFEAVRTAILRAGDEKAAKKFALVAEAHDVLSDPTKRRQYDQTFGKPQRRPQPGFGGGFGSSGFNFNFQSSGFGGRPRAPPRRRPPPPRQPPPLPPQVVKAQRLVGRISSLSRLRKAALNPDTGTASKHVFHAFYTSGSCEDRLDRELRFPYPLVDLDDSKHGDRRWDAHVRYFKTDVSPNKPSSDDALKLAKKLGAEGAQTDANQCPTFVSIKRGASLRAKDVTTHFFRRRSSNAFETWATSQLKVDVTFRNSVKADVVLYWQDSVWKSTSAPPRRRADVASMA
jgi:curved DNA-binding protein CbpA